MRISSHPHNTPIWCTLSLRSWRDLWAGEQRWSRHIPSRALPAKEFVSGEAASEIQLDSTRFNATIYQSSQGFTTRVHGFASKRKALAREISTLYQSSHGFATGVHGFATKTKALAREIPPTTQANIYFCFLSSTFQNIFYWPTYSTIV